MLIILKTAWRNGYYFISVFSKIDTQLGVTIGNSFAQRALGKGLFIMAKKA